MRDLQLEVVRGLQLLPGPPGAQVHPGPVGHLGQGRRGWEEEEGGGRRRRSRGVGGGGGVDKEEEQIKRSRDSWTEREEEQSGWILW